MQATTSRVTPISNARLWTGRVLSALVILFMLLDATIHLMMPPPVVEAFARLGFPISTSTWIGSVELVCTLLYATPRTSVPGAILLTAILGGAVTAHIRVGDPTFDTFIFPAIVGALLWGGLFLRDDRVLAFLLLKR